MTAFSTKLSAFLIGWLAVLAVAAPDAARTPFLDEAVVMAQDGSSARERWEALSPEQRARMQERFERLKGMESGERAQLEQRAKRLRKVERRVVASLSEADRERLMLQPAEKRSQLLSELIDAELRHRGQRIEAKLPKDVRDKLAQASPQERRVRLEEFKRETRERTSVGAVEHIAAALGFGEAEIARLKLLPVEKRMQKVLELRKRLSKDEIEAAGLPRGISAERWKELDELPPQEYFAEIMALRADRSLGDGLRKRGSKEMRAVGHELSEQLKNDPKERLELSELSSTERRAELDRRRRARVMGFVTEHQLLTERQVEILAALPDDEFFRNTRRLAQEIRRGKQLRVGRKSGEAQQGEQPAPATEQASGSDEPPPARATGEDG